MGVDIIRHHGPVGSRQSPRTGTSAWRGGGRTIGSGRVSIWRSDAVGTGRGGLGLGLAVAAQTGTLEKMLLLTRGIFCANLLTVDTLDGKTLKTRKLVSGMDCFVDQDEEGRHRYVKYYGKYGQSRTLSSSLARNSTNAA
jgi:hypothetical protein